jgi:hypothetical protein
MKPIKQILSGLGSSLLLSLNCDRAASTLALSGSQIAGTHVTENLLREVAPTSPCVPCNFTEL